MAAVLAKREDFSCAAKWRCKPLSARQFHQHPRCVNISRRSKERLRFEASTHPAKNLCGLQHIVAMYRRRKTRDHWASHRETRDTRSVCDREVSRAARRIVDQAHGKESGATLNWNHFLPVFRGGYWPSSLHGVDPRNLVAPPPPLWVYQ
jgi:hypothetical protein